MAAYTLINGSDAQITNVDGSGTNVDAHTYKNGITLTTTQLAAVLTTKGVAALGDLTAAADASQVKRIQAIAGLVAST